jgi:hypothetical protein
MGPLPLTLVMVLRRRSARLSSDAVSRKSGESWTEEGAKKWVLGVRDGAGCLEERVQHTVQRTQVHI